MVSKHLSDKAGAFVLKLSKGQYTIKTDTSFYESKTIPITVRGSQDLGEIILTPKKLEEVEVEDYAVDENPNTETVDITKLGLPDNVPLDQITDMVPSLSMVDKTLKVDDKDVEIFLDGKKINFETFKSLPLEVVKSFEITYNPPLSANVGKKAMLNIVTKPKTKLSKGSIGAGVGFLQPQYDGSASYTFKDDKNFLTLGASYYNQERG